MTHATFDAEYVRRLTEGDPETERHFTAYFGQLLLFKLRARLRSPQLVLDARQETFLRVLTTLRRKGGVEHPERLGAFVNAVCNNVLLEMFRAGSRTKPIEEDTPEPVATGDDPETTLVSDARRRWVRQMLDELPDRDREVLRLIFFEEVPKPEICRRLQVDEGYLRVLLHRAKARFKMLAAKESAA